MSQVSLSAFAFLFAELVRDAQERVASVAELESELTDLGYDLGWRLLELVSWRDRGGRRETKVAQFLGMVSTTVWKAVFGRAADGVQFIQRDAQFFIRDSDPITNRFFSTEEQSSYKSGLNLAAFSAGILKGMLHAAGFPGDVEAHAYRPSPSEPMITALLVKGAI
jgi:hypothetical protein